MAKDFCLNTKLNENWGSCCVCQQGGLWIERWMSTRWEIDEREGSLDYVTLGYAGTLLLGVGEQGA